MEMTTSAFEQGNYMPGSGLSQQGMCAGESVQPRSREDVYRALSFDRSVSFDEPLPPLLRFLSSGRYPFIAEEQDSSSQHSFELRRGASVPNFIFADVEKGVWSPKHDRIRAMQKHELSDQTPAGVSVRAFHSERLCNPETLISTVPKCDLSSLRACHSERFPEPETLIFPEAVNFPKKKVPKCSFPSKISFGRHKVTPEMKMGSPNTRLYEKKEKPRVVGYKKTQQKNKKFHSQPNPMMGADAPPHELQEAHRLSGPLPGFTLQQIDDGGDESYSFFKTKATALERPFSRLYTIKPHTEQQVRPGSSELNVGRYFHALQGPELDILRDSEDIVLPVDKKWPFLLRFPIGCFGICLGLGSQTILWKTLSTAASMHFMHVPKLINLTLWCLALMTLLTVFTTYSLKCLFYFEAVRREFYHPVRINFFFAPWIACMFLTLGVPPAVTRSIHPILWVLFMVPIFALELKIYGQWLSGGERRLSKVANPSTHLSLVGNFVGALLAATVGWKELAIFFWAVGLAHYLVLFVTLYQRLPTAAILPKELHPVFFLFVAAPSTASVAWSKIVGDFDLVSRISYFVGLFLYSSLVVQVNFFRGFRFSVAWWAYTFPMTASAIATIHYSLKVKHPFTQGLAMVLSLISSVTVLSLCLFTTLHTFFWCTMFPNDVAIAITDENCQQAKRKIKELEDYSASEASPEIASCGKSRAWQVGKSFMNEVRRMESHLLSAKSDPFPGNLIKPAWV